MHICFRLSLVLVENDRVLAENGGSLCCLKPTGQAMRLYDGICLADGMTFSKVCLT